MQTTNFYSYFFFLIDYKPLLEEEKMKVLVTIIFSFPHHIFKSSFLQGYQISGLFGEVLPLNSMKEFSLFK